MIFLHLPLSNVIPHPTQHSQAPHLCVLPRDEGPGETDQMMRRHGSKEEDDTSWKLVHILTPDALPDTTFCL